MLEVGIVICFVIILLLVFKHVNDSDDSTNLNQGAKMANFWSKFNKKGSKPQGDIEAEIKKGQESIVSPAELNKAQRGYIESDPDIAHLLMKASDAFIENDFRSAEDFAIDALSKDKKCSSAYVIIGDIAFQKNVFEEAKEAYRTALKCNPEMGSAYFGLGKIALQAENFTEAIENLQTAVNLDRNNAVWQVELGKAYMEVRQFAKAAKSYKKAANLDINNREYKDLANEAEAKIRSHSSVYRYK